MTLASHLMASDDGALYDTRGGVTLLRAVYRSHHIKIETGAQLRAALRAGPYAWPGGYPVYFVTSDGAALSFEAVRAELRQVLGAIASGANDGWRVVACQINWELTCEHTGKAIESAYGDTEESANA